MFHPPKHSSGSRCPPGVGFLPENKRVYPNGPIGAHVIGFVDTDNIGIARLREGLELVRIGPALRPEFAAWRYGDQFGRRRMRMVAMATAKLDEMIGLCKPV